ncbi:MAG: hypothetical protein ACOX3Q_13005 [Clostridia bacterium]|jgi:hypothetical protein|nr:hypothetical protein [Clostridiaceae bacterium]
MKTLEEMNREELLEIIEVKNQIIKELETEIALYQKLIEEIKNKYIENNRK